MTNQVTYAIELTPENAPKIAEINSILLMAPEYSTGDQTAKAKEPAKASKPTKPAKASKPTKATEAEESTGTTLEDVKSTAKKAKAEHGEEFAMEVLKKAGVAVGATLGRSMAKIDADMYDTIISSWKAGPQDSEDDLDEDDGFGDEEEDTSEVTADAVKTALKAYAKEVGRDEAKEIMNKYGATALSKVDDCTPKQLSAMFSELV